MKFDQVFIETRAPFRRAGIRLNKYLVREIRRANSTGFT